MIYFFIIIAIVIVARSLFTFQIKTKSTTNEFDSPHSIKDKIQDADFEEID